MKRSLSNSSPGKQSLLTSFLLVALIFSSASAGAKYQGKFQAGFQKGQTAEKAEPASVSFTSTVLRNHALTTFPGQYVASDTAKQNRFKYSASYPVLAPGRFGAPAAIVRQLLVTTDRSALYLSFCLSRPGGRAPPASA
jgi:hypothetical protein